MTEKEDSQPDWAEAVHTVLKDAETVSLRHGVSRGDALLAMLVYQVDGVLAGLEEGLFMRILVSKPPEDDEPWKQDG